MSADSLRPTRFRWRGYLNPETVVRFSFWTITLCIVIAVITAVLAIWDFAGTDALWRTVATCAVIGGGTLTFAWINSLFERGSD